MWTIERVTFGEGYAERASWGPFKHEVLARLFAKVVAKRERCLVSDLFITKEP